MKYSKEKRELLLLWQVYDTLMSLARKLDRQNGKYAKEVTSRQYMTLLAIQLLQKDGASMISIARKMGTTKQNITQTIPILEKKGYVKKTFSSGNKRRAIIKVTDAGIKAMLEYAETGATVMTDVFFSLTEEEMELLWHLLKKLYRYDGAAYYGFEGEACALFENEYSDMFTKMLKEYRKGAMFSNKT